MRFRRCHRSPGMHGHKPGRMRSRTCHVVADTDNTPYRLASALPVDPPSGKCLSMPEGQSRRILIEFLATTAEVRTTGTLQR